MSISKQLEGYLENASWIRRLFEEGQQMLKTSNEPVYDLTIGNPDLEPPAKFQTHLLAVAQDSARGLHKYMSNVGYEETRGRVAEAMSGEYGLPFDANGIIMTVGAAGAINVALKVLLDPGDEVIVITPYFVEYRFYIENHGGQMVLAESDSNFDLDIDAIAAKISDRTRVVLINNPNNPTGVVYTQERLDALGALLAEHSQAGQRPIFLLDDAPYRKLVYDMKRCTSALSAYGNTLFATSHSKDLGIPGERIGFLAVSPRCQGRDKILAAAGFANRSLGFVNAPAMMQRVVAELQTETIDIGWYKKKRDRLYGELTRMGYEMPRPAGAFYIFPKAPGGDDMAFVEKLKSMRLLAVPGRGFGVAGYFRIAYCVRDEILEGALAVFEKAIP